MGDGKEIRDRFYLSTSAYIRTESCTGGWQRSHSHRAIREFYVVERGWMLLVEVKADGRFEVMKLNEGDSAWVAPGTAHNVFLVKDAVIHTVKCGNPEDDWFPEPILDNFINDRFDGDGCGAVIDSLDQRGSPL